MNLARVILPLLCLWSASGLAAQEDAPDPSRKPLTAAQRAQAMIDEERSMVSTKGHRADCPVDPFSNGIVVCAPDTSARYRIPPSDDPHTPSGTRGGGLTPPDMYGGPACTGVCIRGGYAPPPVYYIDLSKIPEAPPGSDADKIAKGEARAP
jgi:hypothetical protein